MNTQTPHFYNTAQVALALFLVGYTAGPIKRFYLVTEILHLGECTFNKRRSSFWRRMEMSANVGPKFPVAGAEAPLDEASIF